MFPTLHDAVQNEVLDDIGPTRFNGNNSDQGANNKYPTTVMGRFTCPNSSCYTAGWGSKTVAVLIRGYRGNGYSAVVFNQRCKTCNALGKLTLHEDSYVERVAYRLRVWAGVDMERRRTLRRRARRTSASSARDASKGIVRWLTISADDGG